MFKVDEPRTRDAFGRVGPARYRNRTVVARGVACLGTLAPAIAPLRPIPTRSPCSPAPGLSRGSTPFASTSRSPRRCMSRCAPTNLCHPCFKERAPSASSARASVATVARVASPRNRSVHAALIVVRTTFTPRSSSVVFSKEGLSRASHGHPRHPADSPRPLFVVTPSSGPDRLATLHREVPRAAPARGAFREQVALLGLVVTGASPPQPRSSSCSRPPRRANDRLVGAVNHPATQGTLPSCASRWPTPPARFYSLLVKDA